MIYRFRIVLDALEDVFRDIEIDAEGTLEDLHNAITQAFEFQGHEMASFYLSDNDWNQGEEIVLFSMTEGKPTSRVMDETDIDTVVSKEKTKMIYVYDFLDMWTFYVELADIVEPESGIAYPNLMYSHGIMPENPPRKQFESEEEDLDEEFGAENIDFDNFDDMDFNQRWN